MTGKRGHRAEHDSAVLGRIRRIAGPVLLGVFVVAIELAPVGHLVTHRNDHTHGPDLGAAAHAAAHRAGLSHAHAPTDDGLTPAERAWLDGGETPPPPEEPADHDHGAGSVAHFALALLQGPPPPILPPPAEAIAPPADAVPHGHDAPALQQPPARGPPA